MLYKPQPQSLGWEEDGQHVGDPHPPERRLCAIFFPPALSSSCSQCQGSTKTANASSHVAREGSRVLPKGYKSEAWQLPSMRLAWGLCSFYCVTFCLEWTFSAFSYLCTFRTQRSLLVGLRVIMWFRGSSLGWLYARQMPCLLYIISPDPDSLSKQYANINLELKIIKLQENTGSKQFYMFWQ